MASSCLVFPPALATSLPLNPIRISHLLVSGLKEYTKKFASHLNLTDDSMWIMMMMMMMGMGWDYYDSAHSAPCLYLLFTVGKFSLSRIFWSRFSRFMSMTKQPSPERTHTHIFLLKKHMSNMQRIEWMAFDWLLGQELLAKSCKRVQHTHTADIAPQASSGQRKKRTCKRKCC